MAYASQISALRERQKFICQCWSAEENKALLNFFIKIMTKVLDVERCSIFVNSPMDAKVWLQTGTGQTEHSIEVPAEGTIVGEVIRTGQYKVATGLENREGVHQEIYKQTGFVTRNVLCVPIRAMAGDRTLGAIEVMNKRDGQFSDEDRKTLEELAHILQVNIENVFLNQEAIGLSERLHRTLGKLTMGAMTLVLVVGTLFVLYLVTLLVAPSLLS